MQNLQPNGQGALSHLSLIELLDHGFVKDIDNDFFKPSSIDLPISKTMYEVSSVFQVDPRKTVLETLQKISKIDLPTSHILEIGKVYVIPIEGYFDLPEGMYGYANPKSTSGRLNLHIRLLADHTAWYDTVPAGYKGKLYILVQPKSFRVQVEELVALNQLRLFNKNSRLKQSSLEALMQSTGVLFVEQQQGKKQLHFKDLSVRDDNDSLLLSLDLCKPLIGYKAIPCDTPIVYNSKNSTEWKKYFKGLYKSDDTYLLEKGEFYILSTLEHVMIPPQFAAEMASMDDRLGEFRAHYAGFFDPGWGYGADGSEQGRTITLEVCAFENILVRHGQPVGRMKIELLTEEPTIAYDAITSNYTYQNGPKLARQFKM